MKLNEVGKSFNKVKVLTCVKMVFGGKSFQDEIKVFILDESNEKIDTYILKLEKLFWKKLLLHSYTSDYYFVIEKSRYGWS